MASATGEDADAAITAASETLAAGSMAEAGAAAPLTAEPLTAAALSKGSSLPFSCLQENSEDSEIQKFKSLTRV